MFIQLFMRIILYSQKLHLRRGGAFTQSVLVYMDKHHLPSTTDLYVRTCIHMGVDLSQVPKHNHAQAIY